MSSGTLKIKKIFDAKKRRVAKKVISKILEEISPSRPAHIFYLNFTSHGTFLAFVLSPDFPVDLAPPALSPEKSALPPAPAPPTTGAVYTYSISVQYPGWLYGLYYPAFMVYETDWGSETYGRYVSWWYHRAVKKQNTSTNHLPLGS